MTEGTLIKMEMSELVELVSEGVARRVIAPIQEDMSKLNSDVLSLKSAVIGNGTPSLQKQITKVAEDCHNEHQLLHARISKTSKLRERVVGAWLVVATLGTVLLGAVEIWSIFSGRK